MTPEQRARQQIDKTLSVAGWLVQAPRRPTSPPGRAWPFAFNRPQMLAEWLELSSPPLPRAGEGSGERASPASLPNKSTLFGQPDRAYHLNEVVRLAGVGIGSVARERDKLTGSGLLTMQKVGNQNRYQANRESPIFDEIRGIVLKTFGLADVLKDALAELAGRITLAFVYGSVAKGADTAASDIDLLVIADRLTCGDLGAKDDIPTSGANA